MQEQEESFTGKWVPLLGFLIASYAAGLIGSLATNEGLQFWYITLNKPTWNPPSWVFGPVWTILYFLMGLAAWQVWRSDSDQKPLALTLFFIQLVLNALWSWIFFQWHRLLPAFVELIVLVVAVLLTTIMFFRARPSSGWMMAPYIAWLCFAAVLNYTIWRLNP